MPHDTDISTRVLEKIKEKKIHMRPKLYFAAQIILVAVLSLGALILTMFIMSFVLFSLQESGEQFLLGFGLSGIITFLILFPWMLFEIDIILVLLVEWLWRLFKFGYRTSLLAIFLLIIMVALLGSLALNSTSLHRALLDKADQDKLPLIGSWYEQIHDSHVTHGIFRGKIISIKNKTVVISHDDTDRDTDDGTWTVMLPSVFNVATLHEGDKLYVAGDNNNGIIQAYGIHVVTNLHE
ncbi:MAG: hypothetical protein KGI50_01715 [Patescibacteria group bacterium]|nr:hypothetical protein [Patescibacteria group bacterium]MDE2437939.1 hypothetical protein [Patescibacteria group bacterium]